MPARYSATDGPETAIRRAADSLVMGCSVAAGRHNKLPEKTPEVLTVMVAPNSRDRSKSARRPVRRRRVITLIAQDHAAGFAQWLQL
jgi:hypothetical protein